MEFKKMTGKLQNLAGKYRYALLVLVIGIALLLIPGKSGGDRKVVNESISEPKQSALTQDALAEILQSIHGAGKVKVLLSISTGEETLYQTDTETATDSQKIQTVIITDSQRNEAGLIRQVNPVTYLGAIVVCQGADSPAVRLAITQAVTKITGLGADAICVLKMQ